MEHFCKEKKILFYCVLFFKLSFTLKEIQATFEGRNPEGQDFHGIKQLLSQLFLKAHINLGQMTDMLIGQSGVGSVLKQVFN